MYINQPHPVVSLDFALPLILVGLIVGVLANVAFKRTGRTVLADILLGVIGAFVGGLAFDVVGFRTWSIVADLIAGICGSVAILYVARFLNK